MITEDPALLAPSTVAGSTPRLGILMTIEQAFLQCGKALIRSRLWSAEQQLDRSVLPSSGEVLRAVADPTLDAEAYDRDRAARYARGDGLY